MKNSLKNQNVQKCEELNISEFAKSLSAKLQPTCVAYRHFPKHVNSMNSLFLAATHP